MDPNRERELIEKLEHLLSVPGSEVLRRIDRENSELGVFIKLYAGRPGTSDLESRSSLREDTVVRELTRLLADETDGSIHVMDVCCGEGSLARRILSSLDGQAVGRIRYCAIDQDHGCIASIKARMDEFKRFQEFRYLQRQAWDLADMEPSATDLIVLNNSLHEIPPHLYPTLFTILNRLLHPQRGRLCIVDMETLPDDAPEAMAIMWRGQEVEQLLRLAGVAPELSIHPKSTSVYQVHIRYSPKGVDHQALKRGIEDLIRQKMDGAIRTRRKLESQLMVGGGVVYREWLLLTGTIARYADELQVLSERIEATAHAGQT